MSPVYGNGFKIARAAAIERSKGTCQFCGIRAATDGHHWAVDYPSDKDITADDITALCSICHSIATNLRRYHRAGGDSFQFMARFKKEISQ